MYAVLYLTFYPLLYEFADTVIGIIVQPFRFEIVEELGCGITAYSYVGYILDFAPELICNIACLILARESSLTNIEAFS